MLVIIDCFVTNYQRSLCCYTVQMWRIYTCVSQLQSMFSPEERLTRHGELSIRPREDVTIHLLFAPTRVACMLAKLEIKQSGVRPSQPGVKFTVRMLFFLSIEFSLLHLLSICFPSSYRKAWAVSKIWLLSWSDSTFRLRRHQQHHPGGPEETGGRLCGHTARHCCGAC